MAEDNFSTIINNFKNMINNNASNSDSSANAKNNADDKNLNITPEMIGNLANMLNNSSQENSGPDSFNSSKSASSEDSSSQSGIDFETILKLKSIMETLNQKDDPRSKLLYSLKPYLRESKQKKLDQYVNLFKIAQISNLFKNEKGAGS